MRDLSSRETVVNTRVVIIAALIALLIGLIVILVLFAGGSNVDVDTPIYKDGKLYTTISNSGDEETVWVQYRIFRQEGLGSEQIGDTFSYAVNLKKKGNTLSTCDVNLAPGPYKIFIYISTYENNSERIAGFVRDIEVV